MERSLRILHVDTETTWRGGEQQALYLATGLAARGHAVAMAARPGSAMAERARRAGLAVHELPLRGELNPAASLGLRRLLRAGGYQIIHAHTSHAHTQAAIAARLAGGVRCVVSRRVDFGLDRSPWRINRLKYRFGVDRYIAISQAVRDVLVQGGVAAERVALVHSGIDLDRLRDADPTPLRAEFALDPAAPVVGAVAHLAWHKGLATLIDAAPAILARHPRTRFLVAGDGELRAELQRHAERVAPGAFLFPGFRHDIPAVLSLLDVVCCPSLMEGLNTTNLDALALRRAVVASAVGGIPEAVQHERTGLLVAKADPPALADAVLRLLDDPALARRLGDAGRMWIEQRFTKEAMTDGTLGVYRELLDRPVTAPPPVG